jgi:F0F1-type ATP synthase epsilon subunit
LGLEVDLTKTAVSGGFAIVQPNSVLSINAVEGFPLEEFSEEAVRSQISEAQKVASGSGSEQDIAEAKIELEVGLPLWSYCDTTNTYIGSGVAASSQEIDGC